MKITEKTRAKLFWFYDKIINNNKVKNFYNDIKYIQENAGAPYIKAKRNNYISKILTHAVSTVPFYKEYYGFTSILDFPVINKTVIRENENYFFSEKFSRGKLFKVTTSGSTGAPLTIWQDKIKRQRRIAENIYFSELAGYLLGTRLYYLRVWNEINRKNFIISKVQNIIMQDASNLSDKNIESFLIRLEKDNSTKSILAFSSTLEAIAQFLEKTLRNINSEIKCILSISEALPEGAREILRQSFKCPVISRYSNMENGFIAQQCGHHSGEYHLNLSGYFIELLHPERDDQVNPGEIGRIVVTDLFNYAMPLIRYDTGDIGIISENSFCGKPGPVFFKIEGRRVDFIYDTSGNLLSPHVVTNTMWRYSNEIKQFQFIQNDKHNFILKINSEKLPDYRENQIISDLKNFIGFDSNIVLEYVNEIPFLSSGKRKKIINNYIPT